MISTSNFKPCEECGKIECNDKQCLKEADWENEGGKPKSRYRPAKTVWTS